MTTIPAPCDSTTGWRVAASRAPSFTIHSLTIEHMFDSLPRALALPFQPSFDDLSTPLYDVTFCVLDLETTGGSPKECEITEIGAVKFRGGEKIGSFQTLVDPGAPIPPMITILTGITHAMVVDAPRIETALPSFLEFVGDSVVVGHNVRFDISFLDAAARRLGYPPVLNDRIDTAALARRLVRGEVRNLKLRSLAAYFRSPVTPNHRALEDATATAHVLHDLLERVGNLGVTNLDDLLALPRASGSPYYGKMRLTEALPRSPGVYEFRDRHGTVIYVGKATNLRQRVRQYFYGDKRKTIGNMLRELHSIEHRPCVTALEAEVTELRLIHAHRPRYNRRSRPPKSSHYLRVTADRFPRLSIVRTVKSSALAHIGPFRSRRAADLVMTAIWDALPIRRCSHRPGSRAAPCAAAQLGVAMCPCDGSLGEAAYADVVNRLLRAIDTEPGLLLDPLVERMDTHSNALRYEEAAWVRDRHDALARALTQRWRWQSLQRAGTFQARNENGDHVLVDHGYLVASWSELANPPLRPAAANEVAFEEVASSVLTSDEANLIWKWIESGGVSLEESTGALAWPAAALPVLSRGKR